MRGRIPGRARWGRLVAGVSIVAVSLAGVWWVIQSSNNLEGYLVAGRDVLAGEAFEQIPLEVVYLASPSGNPGLIPQAQQDRWAGQVAVTALPAGTLLVAPAFEIPAPTNQTSFSVRIEIGQAGWLEPGRLVDVWVSAPRDDQQFSVPEVASPAARIVSVRQDEGFAANPDIVRVEVEVASRDLPQLIHARANSFDIQLSPTVPATSPGIGQ